MKFNDKLKTIAKERINILFKQANKSFKKNPKLSNRYINLARKIAMKSRIRIPRELKRKFCKHCYHYLKSGVNLRIRTKDKKVVYYCSDCKKYMRFPIKTKH
jgi:ribonuclease P protein subunit RPR2